MALELAIYDDPTDPVGPDLVSTYWRVVEVNIAVGDGRANVIAYGYKSKVARESKGAPIGQVSKTIEGDEFKQFYMDHIAGRKNLFQQAYDVLKEATDPVDSKKTFFAAAKDV